MSKAKRKYYTPEDNNLHVLLIWDESPEQVRLFALPYGEMPPTALPVIKKAHGQYVNGSEDSAYAEILNWMLEKSGPTAKQAAELVEWDETWAGCLQNYEVDPATPLRTDIDCVVKAGFIM